MLGKACLGGSAKAREQLVMKGRGACVLTVCLTVAKVGPAEMPTVLSNWDTCMSILYSIRLQSAATWLNDLYS